MITIITGTPDAGKTLYAIEKLLVPLVGKTIKHTNDQGNEVEIPRTIYTNINGLQIDHELIDGGENQGLRDWHKWAKPGSVIVFDEFQKSWPPRANGSKVPEDIQSLDTHRHMGVDFVLITQSVMNTDRHIHALAGRHLHVRRVGNMKAAIVYEWDHVSKSLMYSKAISKAPWRYSAKIFKLYKSAELHTKQPRRLPTLVWFVLGGLGLAAYMGPTTYQRLYERTHPGEVAKAASDAKTVAGEVQPLSLATVTVTAPDERVDFMPRISDRPWTAPAYDQLRTVVQMPLIAGGVCMNGRCVCVTGDGASLEISSSSCADWIKSRPFNPYQQQQPMGGGGFVGTVSAGTPSVRGQTALAPVEAVSAVSMPSGASNPRSDATPPSLFPPGSPVHTTPSENVWQSTRPPSLLSPYRNHNNG